MNNYLRISLTLLILVCFQSLAQAQKTDSALFVHAVDGDTLIVKRAGIEEHLRLIGIDAPESSMNKKAKKDSRRIHRTPEIIFERGRKAAQYLENILKKDMPLRLEFDIEKRDQYRRTLAYVYLPDGQMLNEKILRDGYAFLFTYPPNVKYVERLRRAYNEAKEHRRGLWAEMKPRATPTPRPRGH